RRERVEHPRARRSPCRAAPDRGADLQPHPRAARRAETPLPVPLARAPERGARGRHPAQQAAGHAGTAGRAGGHGGTAAALPGAAQAARGGRVAGLGAGVAVPGRGNAGRRDRRPHAGRGAEVPGGHRAGPRGRSGRAAGGVIMTTVGTPSTRSGRPDVLSGLVAFTRALSAAGLPVSMDRVTAYLEAVRSVDLAQPDALYWAGRLTLCGDPDDIALYDGVFRQWFLHQ